VKVHWRAWGGGGGLLKVKVHWRAWGGDRLSTGWVVDWDHRAISPATTPGVRPESALILQKGGHPSPVLTLIIIIIITLRVNPEVVHALQRGGHPSQALIHTILTTSITLTMRRMADINKPDVLSDKGVAVGSGR
jgi:hypothetical protein